MIEILATVDRLSGQVWKPVPRLIKPRPVIFGKRRRVPKKILLIAAWALIPLLELLYRKPYMAAFQDVGPSALRAIWNGDAFLATMFTLLSLSVLANIGALSCLSMAAHPLWGLIRRPAVSVGRRLRTWMTLTIACAVASVATFALADATLIGEQHHNDVVQAGAHAAFLATRLRRSTAAHILADVDAGVPDRDAGVASAEIEHQLKVAPRRERNDILKMLQSEASGRVPEPRTPIE